MARALLGLSRGALYALLVWAPLAASYYRGWPLAVTQLLALVALVAWLGAMLAEGRLEWRRTALDLPLALVFGLVALQLLVAHRPLVAWALGPPPSEPALRADFPAPFAAVGTVAPRQTLASLLLFGVYASVYVLVVNLVRTRRQIGRLVRGLVLLGALLAFLGLIDYLTGETWLVAWRNYPYGHRLVGPFINPDHFAPWLAMLIGLGLGWLLARAARPAAPLSLAALLSVRELRERAVRRYLPLVGVVTMGLAVTFTLSRGGVLALVGGLLVLLLLLAARGRARRSLVLTGVLLLGVLGYGSWIGFGPLLSRFGAAPAGAEDRWTQYAASLAMLRDFPLLGVGLGAYREIYFRYQPLAHEPAVVWYGYAHNDLLQLALETGVPGAALFALALWRVGRDLVRAHLFGRGACPVDGGAGAAAERHDPYSVGIAVGALAALAAMLVDATMDFALRIPANGVLAAALLGLATVALHSRLHPGEEQLLSGAWQVSLTGRRRLAAAALAAVAVAGAALWAGVAVRAARATGPLDHMERPPSLAVAEAILAIDPASVPARQARARAREDAALAVWTAREPSDPAERNRRAAALLAQGRADLRAALGLTPTNPFLHHDLAWVEAIDAVVSGGSARARLDEALAHASRAVALQPENPRFYASVARLAAATRPRLGLAAAREALRRGPALLAELVDTYRPIGLTETEWLQLVPESAVDRAALAEALEARSFAPESLVAYRAALEVAPPHEGPVYRWLLAEAFGRRGREEAAQAQLAAALAADPGNPELHRAMAEVLARRGDPAALESLRRALLFAGRLDPMKDGGPFGTKDARLAALVARQAGEDLARPTRYRRALARYLLDRKLWDEAVGEWRALAQALPRDAEARFSLGVALEATGATDVALEEYRQAVALDPGSTRFRERLAQRLWDTEQYYQAINEWRVLKGQAPQNIGVRLALARALEKIGERLDAFREYREILDVSPGNAGAREGLGRLSGASRVRP